MLDMSKKAYRQTLPETLCEIALIDGRAAAAVGSVSLSYWLRLVRDGVAPGPALRRHKCTRWRVTDVRDFWLKLSIEIRPAQNKKAPAKAKTSSPQVRWTVLKTTSSKQKTL
ncbi:hypothetical protein VARIO8X_110098 [Burkholderiales bacterium 8X]|nr:hypothetical protein VARIO8X_110098 [Burkholderiales bacterium 8X]